MKKELTLTTLKEDLLRHPLFDGVSLDGLLLFHSDSISITTYPEPKNGNTSVVHKNICPEHVEIIISATPNLKVGANSPLNFLSSGDVLQLSHAFNNTQNSPPIFEQQQATAIRITLPAFKNMLNQSVELSNNAQKLMANSIQQQQGAIKFLSGPPTEQQRIAHTLITLAQKIGTQHELGIAVSGFSRTDIGKMINIFRKHVGRTFNDLANSGLAYNNKNSGNFDQSLIGKATIVIPNIERLKNHEKGMNSPDFILPGIHCT